MSLVRIIPNFEPPKFSNKQNHHSTENCNIYMLNTIARGTKIQRSPIWSIIQHLLVLQMVMQCLSRARVK